MNENLIIPVLSLLIAFFSMITNYLLQKEKKKMKELERKNEKLKSNLIKSLNAIKSYQSLESETAKSINMNLSNYRKKIRKDYDISFNSDFLVPSNINNLLENFNN
jgi:ABC-type transport system involved in cytochrome bd biosynthesis fused ATPase/permease subunit